MPISLEQIVEETRHWPPEKRGALVDRLTEDLRVGDPKIEAAWKIEIDRRIADIESGSVKGVALEESLARARKMVGL